MSASWKQCNVNKMLPTFPLLLPPLAVNIKGKLKMSAAVRDERRRARGWANNGSYTARIRNVVRFCADVFAYLPATQTQHHTQQWPIYPNMCAANRGRQGRGEWGVWSGGCHCYLTFICHFPQTTKTQQRPCPRQEGEVAEVEEA